MVLPLWNTRKARCHSSTTEYTGLRTSLLKLYGANGFFLRFQPLSRFPESRSYLHIQVCEISIYPTGRWGDRQSVKRTLDPSPTSVQDVGVNHCRAHVIMSEKFLNCSYIMTVFQKMRCKRMVKRMWSGRRNPGTKELFDQEILRPLRTLLLCGEDEM